jgi:hypothetical protein
MSDTPDDLLLRRLAEAAAAIDPPPERWRTAARASLAWRPVDAELARLLHDSADPATALAGAGVRAASGPRQLSYGDDDRLLELEVTRRAADLTLVGQVVPADAGEVLVHQPGRAVVAVPTDDVGGFRVEQLPDRGFAVEVRTPAGPGAAQRPSLWTGLIQP